MSYEERDDRFEPNSAVVAGGLRGKDDRKQNTLAPLIRIFLSPCFTMKDISNGGYTEVNRNLKPLEAFEMSF